MRHYPGFTKCPISNKLLIKLCDQNFHRLSLNKEWANEKWVYGWIWVTLSLWVNMSTVSAIERVNKSQRLDLPSPQRPPSSQRPDLLSPQSPPSSQGLDLPTPQTPPSSQRPDLPGPQSPPSSQRPDLPSPQSPPSSQLFFFDLFLLFFFVFLGGVLTGLAPPNLSPSIDWTSISSSCCLKK